MKTNSKQTANTTATTTQTATENARPAYQITAENVQTLGEIVAVRALKTNYQKSGMPYIYELYRGLVVDIRERKRTGEPFSDGYDIAQTASAFLCEHLGEYTTDKMTDGQTDKDGEPIDIWRACFRVVNRYINGEKQREFRRVYVDDINENGERLYYEIPDEWDIPTATDYKRVCEIITALNLTDRQAKILRYRMRGKSLHQIADILGIHRKTLQEHMQAIQRKYTAYTATATTTD